WRPPWDIFFSFGASTTFHHRRPFPGAPSAPSRPRRPCPPRQHPRSKGIPTLSRLPTAKDTVPPTPCTPWYMVLIHYQVSYQVLRILRPFRFTMLYIIYVRTWYLRSIYQPVLLIRVYNFAIRKPRPVTQLLLFFGIKPLNM
ncbi:unnamed protein product, partial [Laminaria digitata]